MAKKGFGKLVVLAAAAGAAAAGISYLKKYRSFNDELEEEFHDFEGSEEDDDDLFEEEETVILPKDEAPDNDETDEPDKDETSAQETKAADAKEEAADPRASRKYIPLNVSKEELKLAAKDMVSAAGEIAGAAKSVLKDAAVIFGDTAHEAAVVAKDTAQIARAKLSERAELHRNRKNEGTSSSDTAPESTNPSDAKEDVSEPAEPTEPATTLATEQEKAQQETAATQFVPNAPAGAAGLEAETEDSVLEVVKPEDAQKAVQETEATTTIEDLEIEELDD